MNIIYPEKLQKKLTNNLDLYYIFLGEDILFLKKNEDLILTFAKKKGFIQKTSININTNKDWNKIFIFCQLKNLFFKKNILIINIYINTGNLLFIKNINKILTLFHINILVILKCYKLSNFFLETKNTKKLTYTGVIVSCFSPNITHFINWVKYEIQEKKIDLEKESILLLCKNYEGNTLFINQILEVISLTWPKKNITFEQIKKIIDNFSQLSPIQWVNSIFQGNSIQAIDIINIFFQQKKNPLILIRTLQNDLLKLLYMKREKNLNINLFLRKNHIWNTRYKYFVHAYYNICFENFFKAIKILVQIEIHIKKEYNHTVWLQLKTLTLILCS